MRGIKTRLEHLERKSYPEQEPRLIVLKPGETNNDAIARLGINADKLRLERKGGRRIIWVRWDI